MLDKALFEAGLQCGKRLYLDARETDSGVLSESRRTLAEAGRQLVELARSAFPKGVAVAGEGADALVAATQELLASEQPVLFGATFRHQDLQVATDILLRQRDGSFDVYEVKSGTKVKQRYLLDLALQVHVMERCGQRVRAAFVLHVNPRYAHTAGAEFQVQQLLKSADVTERVRRQERRLLTLLATLRHQIDDASTLELPTGTWCTNPFPCPHLPRCTAEGPPHPLRELPDLNRDLEVSLHTEAIETISQIDPQRPGLSFRQRRTIQAVRDDQPVVEPFVREELRQVEWPLHVLVLATVTEALPRFGGQRPWRRLPYGFAVQTLHKDGRLAEASHVHADRDDPRLPLVSALARHVDAKGTILCWGCEPLSELRTLLDELPEAKPGVRALLARDQFDLARLFDSGVFHPQLRGRRDLHSAAAVLLGETPGELPLHDDEQVLAALQKAAMPRTRSTTKDKIATDVAALLRWRAQAMLALYRRFSGFEPETPAPKPQAPRPGAPRKRLPLDDAG